MVISLSLLFLMVSLSLIKKRKGTLKCLATIYVILWYVALAVSSLGLYGLYIPSVETYVICFISAILFTIVSIKKGAVETHIERDDVTFSLYERRDIIIYIVHALIYLFVANNLQNAIAFIMSDGFGALRSADKGQSTSYLIVMQWIVVPVFSVTTILGCIDYLRNRKMSVILILALTDTATYSAMYGGRYSIFRLLFFLVFLSLLFTKDKITNYLKENKLIIIVASLIVALLSLLTSERSLSDLDFKGNIIAYYTGSIVFMDQLMEQFTPDYTYGTLTIGFIWNTICSVLKVLFGTFWGSNLPYEAVSAGQLQVGKYTLYNSLCTYIYPYIMDFGRYFFWIGVLIFSHFVNYIEKLFSTRRSYPLIVVYVFVAYTIFDSLLFNNYIYPNFLFVVIFSFLFLKRKKICQN